MRAEGSPILSEECPVLAAVQLDVENALRLLYLTTTHRWCGEELLISDALCRL
ncbi:MAG: hypothetical protein QHG99_02575 [Methanomicrobiales archaeon]|nr:hypothetical protein [Methanomicrobiales archaeon]